MMWYNIISYHITSYYMIWYDIGYDIMSYHITSYHILYHIISYHITSYYIIWYNMISYHIISHHIISYHTPSNSISLYHLPRIRSTPLKSLQAASLRLQRWKAPTGPSYFKNSKIKQNKQIVEYIENEVTRTNDCRRATDLGFWQHFYKL